MKEDFVTLEIAKKLKEKGYTGGTNGKYIEKVPGSEREEWDDVAVMYVTVTDVISYPKAHIYDAMKWLREEKGIDILVHRGHISINNKKEVTRHYCVNIYFIDRFACTVDNDEQDYPTYEQAAIAGIEYVLDNLI